MHKRIEAGTDIAKIGAWDASADQPPFTADQRKRLTDALKTDATEGKLFLIHTGADGGGAIDLYIDEPLPIAVQHTTQPLDGTFLLRVPTGRLVGGGVEDYRSGRPRRVIGDQGIVAIPAGDYAVRCHVPDSPGDEEEDDDLTLSDIEEKTLTPEELEYYHKKRLGRFVLYLIGWLLFLAFFPLKSRLGWKIALPITLVVALPYFHWLEWLSKRRSAANPRWTKLRQRVTEAWLAHQPRTMALELTRLTDPGGPERSAGLRGELVGGSVRLDRRRKSVGKAFEIKPSEPPASSQEPGSPS